MLLSLRDLPEGLVAGGDCGDRYVGATGVTLSVPQAAQTCSPTASKRSKLRQNSSGTPPTLLLSPGDMSGASAASSPSASAAAAAAAAAPAALPPASPCCTPTALSCPPATSDWAVDPGREGRGGREPLNMPSNALPAPDGRGLGCPTCGGTTRGSHEEDEETEGGRSSTQLRSKSTPAASI